MKVIEEFEGFLDRVEEGTAFFTLKSKADSKDVLWCECSFEKFQNIRLRRRFLCQVIETDGKIDFAITSIPDREVDEDAIVSRIDKALGGDFLPQED